MDDPLSTNIVCPSCGKVFSSSTKICSQCRTVYRSTQRGLMTRWGEKQILIICILVFGVLFFGFPLLWRSPEFSLRAKILWTGLITLETILIFWAFFWVLFHIVIPPIQNALGY